MSDGRALIHERLPMEDDELTVTEEAQSAWPHIAKALAAAQAAMRDAPLNAENPHFKSKYADWSSVRKATVPHLSANGLTITQFTRMTDTGLMLVTRLMHVSGQSIEGEYPLPAVYDKPQVMGSALTYAKRYCWAMICGIAPGEDDDANVAEAASGKRRHGPEEPVIGALTKTALQKEMREFDEALSVCAEEDQLYGLLHSYDAKLKQCARDLPSWWLTKEGSDVLGLRDRIEAKKKELEQRKELEQA